MPTWISVTFLFDRLTTPSELFLLRVTYILSPFSLRGSPPGTGEPPIEGSGRISGSLHCIMLFLSNSATRMLFSASVRYTCLPSDERQMPVNDEPPFPKGRVCMIVRSDNLIRPRSDLFFTSRNFPSFVSAR